MADDTAAFETDIRIRALSNGAARLEVINDPFWGQQGGRDAVTALVHLFWLLGMNDWTVGKSMEMAGFAPNMWERQKR